MIECARTLDHPSLFRVFEIYEEFQLSFLSGSKWSWSLVSADRIPPFASDLSRSAHISGQKVPIKCEGEAIHFSAQPGFFQLLRPCRRESHRVSTCLTLGCHCANAYDHMKRFQHFYSCRKRHLTTSTYCTRQSCDALFFLSISILIRSCFL